MDVLFKWRIEYLVSWGSCFGITMTKLLGLDNFREKRYILRCSFRVGVEWLWPSEHKVEAVHIEETRRQRTRGCVESIDACIQVFVSAS